MTMKGRKEVITDKFNLRNFKTLIDSIEQKKNFAV